MVYLYRVCQFWDLHKCRILSLFDPVCHISLRDRDALETVLQLCLQESGQAWLKAVARALQRQGQVPAVPRAAGAPAVHRLYGAEIYAEEINRV